MNAVRLIAVLLVSGSGFCAMPALAHTPAFGHVTTTAVVCSPDPWGVDLPATCTATVTDVSGGGADAVPVGAVNFAASGAGAFSATSCTLAPAGGFSASCSVTYTPSAVGNQTITATYPTTTSGGHRWGTSTGIVVLTTGERPEVAKSFSATVVGTLVSSTLTITLSNANATAITGVAFTDTYPGGLVNAAAPGAATTCGGTVTAAGGGGSVALSGGTIPASGSCTVTVSVTSAAAGSYPNSIPAGGVTSANAGSNASASATVTLTVLDRPAVSKAFSPNPIVTGAASVLTITLSNANAIAITGVAFTDAYPAGLVNAAAPGAGTTCGGIASAAAGGGTVSLSGGTIPAGGGCTVTVSVTSATVGSYPNSIPVGGVTSTNAGSNTIAASATLIVNAAVVAFDAVEAGAAPGTRLFTKLSGVSFSVDILALDVSSAVSAGYTGTVALDLVDAASSAICASMTSLQSLGNQTYTVADGGRKAVSITYASAARNARIRIIDSSLGITSCSFDAFAIRPSGFASVTSNMTNTGTTGAPNTTAGGNFTLTATTLSGYDGTPSIDATRIAAHAGALQTGALAGAFPAATPATGVASGTTFTYSEVGNFRFLAQGVLDDTFTAVDQPGDCTGDFSNILAGGRYGCKFGNTAATSFFGRFTPDHFVVSAVSLTNRSDLACVPASIFTYMSEPIALGFTLTASNAAGGTTQNYTTASGFARLAPGTPGYFNVAARDALVGLRAHAISAITQAAPGQVTAAGHGFIDGDRVYITGAGGMSEINGQTVTVTVVDANNFTIGVDTSGYGAFTSGGTASRLSALGSAGSWVAGAAAVTAAVQLERSATPDGPYAALNIGIAPRDDDGIGLLSGALNLDADASGSNDSFTVGATEARFGRLRLQNAFGSELLDLPVPLEAQYLSGGIYLTNTDDNCTSISAGNLVLSSGVATLGGAFVAGRGNLKITKPGTKVSIDVCADLDVSAGTQNDLSCLAGVPANKTYLQWKWSGSGFRKDPEARAMFGVFKNADEFIYLRENF